MKHSILFFLLTILMSMVGAKTFAHDIEVKNADGKIIYYNYTNDNTELEVTYRGSWITEYLNEYQGNVVIPDEVTYMDVTRKVTMIGSEAFYGCSGMTSITIPNSVTSIGKNAFLECSGLNKVIIPDIAAWCNINFSDYDDNPLSFALHLYSDEKTEIKDLVIPNSVTSIGDNTFHNCAYLTSVTIDSGVKSIGSCAFSECHRLTSVTIGNDVKSIGSSAFSGCHRLTSITIGKSIESIGARAFDMCNDLAKVVIRDIAAWCGVDFQSNPLSLTHRLYSDEHTEIKDLVIPNSVTNIGNSAFSSCTGLSSVTIGNSVKSIGRGAFSGCTGLKKVIISDIASWCGIDFASNPLEYAHHLYSDENTEIKDLVIPNSVTNIGNSAFSSCTGLSSVTIPNSVTGIGNSAFSNCTGLSSITIPNSVTSIGNSAFYNCTGFSSITIPNSVTSIGNSVLSGCLSLISIIVENGNTKYDSRNNCNAIIETLSNELIVGCKNTVVPESVTSIGDRAFYGCSGLTSITIPNSVSSIGEYAFNRCSSLTSITIPNSVTNIGTAAFSGCTGLTDFTMGNGVESIAESAFYGCSSLTSITIGNSVESIAESAFYGCSSLTSITIGNSVTSIGRRAFEYCSGLVTVTIGNSVKNIGDQAFSYCTRLTTVSIGNSVKNIGDAAFSACFSLQKVIVSDIAAWCGIKFADNPLYYAHHLYSDENTEIKELVIPNSVTSIGNSAFHYCSGLTSVTIGNSVTSIGRSAFSGCTGLRKVIVSDIAAWCGIDFADNPLDYAHHLYSDKDTEIKDLVIPNSVTSIGDGAFSGCSGLTSVTIPNSVTSIGQNTFYSCSGLTSVTIPNSVTSIGNGAFYGCTALMKVIVADITAWCGIQFVSAVNGSNNPLSYAHHLFSDENTEIKDLVIPNSVTSISEGAFYGCVGLSSVTIPNSVTIIGDYAFDGCSGLTSVTIPNSVTRIGSSAFYSCSGLTSVTIGNSVTSIGSSAFYSCSGLTSVTIPNSVTNIGGCAFDGAYIPIVVSLIENPLTISGNIWSAGVFYIGSFSQDTFNNATLYVPNGTIDKYRTTDGWKDFVNIVEGAPAGIDAPQMGKDVKVVDAYQLNGLKRNDVQRGLNIVRMSDGATRKVVVK